MANRKRVELNEIDAELCRWALSREVDQCTHRPGPCEECQKRIALINRIVGRTVR